MKAIRFVLAVFGLLAIVSFNPPKAVAAAICYSAPSSSLGSPFAEVPASVTNCADQYILELEYPGGLEDDRCYIVYETPVGQTGFTLPNTDDFALGTSQCDTLADKSANTAESTARCKLFDSGLAGYYSGDRKITQFSDDVDCEELRDEAEQSDIFTGFNSNWCYIFDKADNSFITRVGCGNLVTILISDSTSPSSSGGFVPTSSAQRDALADCDGTSGGQPDQAALKDCLSKNPIIGLITSAINFLSAGVGIILTGVIILGGIQYSTAGANPNAVAAAKGRIVNAIVAFIMYLLIFAFIQWLIPGGIF
ncbi:MAG: pilin [bacterium]|nr:pilin [bacterium]